MMQIARQQSKQEILRAKGFGIPQPNLKRPSDTENSEPYQQLQQLKTKARPDISCPILTSSTLNPTDFESHKCIPLEAEAGDKSSSSSAAVNGSAGGGNYSDSDTTSFYTLESILDDTYR